MPAVQRDSFASTLALSGIKEATPTPIPEPEERDLSIPIFTYSDAAGSRRGARESYCLADIPSQAIVPGDAISNSKDHKNYAVAEPTAAIVRHEQSYESFERYGPTAVSNHAVI
jgi:hypothetical protein